jgi:hypothetical protein
MPSTIQNAAQTAWTLDSARTTPAITNARATRPKEGRTRSETVTLVVTCTSDTQRIYHGGDSGSINKGSNRLEDGECS